MNYAEIKSKYDSLLNKCSNQYFIYIVKYAIIISILTIIMVLIVGISGDEKYYFWQWVLITVSYIIFTTPLAALGKYIAILYGPKNKELNEMDLKWQIFWKYGIQVVGYFIGIFIAVSWFLPKFGIYTQRTY